MKNSATILRASLVILMTILSPLNASAQKVDEDQATVVFEDTDPTNVRTFSNPKLRAVEVIQQNEMTEYEAAGQIESPYIKNGVTQGWLVNSCVVVAPRHAIIDNGNVDKDLTNIQVDFNVGYKGKNNFKQQLKIKSISCGRGNNGEKVDGKDINGGEDFCIYKADRSLKGLVRPIKIGASDYNNSDVVQVTSVGFFPQASGQLDVLAKDNNAKIVNGNSTYLKTRAANISGAGLIDIDSDTKEKYLIGLQVGYFNAVNSIRIIEEIASVKAKNINAFKCN